MTAEATASPRSADAAKPAASDWLILAFAIPAALLAGLVMSLPHLLAVWRTGAFFDSDDAMRLVQVRDLLAGQGWFDMTAYRLDPPAGVFMHWSRVVDVPLVILIKSFSLVLSPDMAERAARLAFPLILQALLYIGIARLAKLLMGSAAIIPALLLTLLSGIVFAQFQPGRIDHHAPQIVLLIFMLANAVAALDPKQARCALWSGLLVALSIAISIEMLPFIVALAGLLVIAWIQNGRDLGRALLWFGLGLGIGLPLSFLATVGPAHWFDASCDAFSTVYLVPGLAGALICLVLGILSQRCERRVTRLLAALVGGLVLAVVFAMNRPICLRDPFTGIDPLLRQYWLNNVVEALPLQRFFRRDPMAALADMMPLLLGVAAMFAAARGASELGRRRWLFVAAMGCVGTALSFWMIRVIGFAGPVTIFGGAWCILTLAAVIEQTQWRKAAAALSLLLVLPFSTIGWAIALPARGENRQTAARHACLTPAAFESLEKLQPGLVLAPIDAGSFILAFTRHQVLAAPYHRDNHGNRALIDTFLAEPSAAEALLRAEKVDYLAYCAALPELAAFADHAPHGLAAALIAGRIPDFLQPVSSNDTDTNKSYHVFKMKFR